MRRVAICRVCPNPDITSRIPASPGLVERKRDGGKGFGAWQIGGVMERDMHKLSMAVHLKERGPSPD
jgi:hypothetical protein